MPGSIAEFYIWELASWKETISFYSDEIDETEKWLKEILQHNTVIHLAETVEHHLNVLDIAKQSFYNLLYEIISSEEKLLEGQQPAKNEAITDMIKQKQEELRQKMQTQEKEYLNARYLCDEFLAETITRQNKKIGNN